MVNETFFKLNFRIDSISDGSPVFHLGKKETYQPLISDVSNVELTDTVKILRKSENIVCPTPYDIFKMKTSWHTCRSRKSIKASDVHKFNLIRSEEAMTNLGQKRWVSYKGYLLCFKGWCLTCNSCLTWLVPYFFKSYFNPCYSIQDSSKAKMKWAMGSFKRWRQYKLEIFHARFTTKITHYERQIRHIHESTDDLAELKAALCDFIVEVRKWGRVSPLQHVWFGFWN